MDLIVTINHKLWLQGDAFSLQHLSKLAKVLTTFNKN